MKKIVDFKTYCALCKHRDKEAVDEPCATCISYPAREDSKRPECYEEMKK